MATATLELINPYAKYGLKRRPTYEEIIGLIGENQTLTGGLPDRTATQFKASQEGSFFDGLDSLEILKEQQQRIQERQMRELMLRQNLGGGTYHLERLRQQRNENTPPAPETPSDSGMVDVQMQTELQRRATDFANRQQQTAHRQGFLSGTATPVLERIFGGLSRSNSRPTTPMAMPSPQRPMPPLPQRQQPQPISIASDVEEVSSGEMQTATDREHTEEPKSAVLRTITYRTNIATLSAEALKFQLFLRGIDADDPASLPEGLKQKGKGVGNTSKQYYLDIALKMIEDGSWQTRVNSELLVKRIADYKREKGKGTRISTARGSKD